MLLAIGDFLRFLVAALFFLLLFIIGLVIGSFVADVLFSPRTTSLTNLTYTTETGETRDAYIHLPSGGRPRPGIILVPDFWGLNDQMVRLTNALGDAGFVVITPDIFHGTTSQVIHRALLLGRMTPRSRVFADLDGAYAYLSEQRAVMPDQIGIVGFGYGGGIALEYVTQNPQMGAVVDLYGPVPGDLGAFDGAVMGLFGSRDRLVRPSHAYQLLGMAQAAGLHHRVEILDGLDNGFMQFPAIILLGRTEHTAWNVMVDFLALALSPPPPCRQLDAEYPAVTCH